MKPLVLVVALFAVSAHAMCAPAEAFVLPWDGATIPEDGVFYLFDPKNPELHDVKIETVDGEPVPFTQKRIQADQFDSVFELRITAKASSKISVRGFHRQPVTVVAKSAAPKKLELTPGTEKNYSWTCSHETTRVLIPSIDAPAFRVKWDDKTFILAGRDGSFSRLDEVVPELALRLGHANCHGNNVVWAKKTKFTITALMADGTEVTAAPMTLEPPKQLPRDGRSVF
ncbi:MAG: hypothetical protein ACO1OB_34460 [Archangium sp.]